MKWKDWPTGPGVYWRKLIPSGHIECVKVDRKGIGLGACFVEFGDAYEWPLRQGDALWCGPLEAPKADE